MSDEDQGDYASPPCAAKEIAPDYFDPLSVDPAQARDVARWRRAERNRLLAARRSQDVAALRAVGQALASHVAGLVAARFPSLNGLTLSGYWPIQSEPDLRPLLSAWHAAGAAVALPVVETRHAPLVFRRWTPDTRMVRGDWNIPVPPPEADRLRPRIALAPLVGWDGEGYRLGYGGGYFDRTLAAMQPRPFVIGVGLQGARLPSIYPQRHDIGLDAIVTEAGVQVLRENA